MPSSWIVRGARSSLNTPTDVPPEALAQGGHRSPRCPTKIKHIKQRNQMTRFNPNVYEAMLYRNLRKMELSPLSPLWYQYYDIISEDAPEILDEYIESTAAKLELTVDYFMEEFL